MIWAILKVIGVYFISCVVLGVALGLFLRRRRSGPV